MSAALRLPQRLAETPNAEPQTPNSELRTPNSGHPVNGEPRTMNRNFCHEKIRTLIPDNFLKICEIGGICGYQKSDLYQYSYSQ